MTPKNQNPEPWVGHDRLVRLLDAKGAAARTKAEHTPEPWTADKAHELEHSRKFIASLQAHNYTLLDKIARLEREVDDWRSLASDKSVALNHAKDALAGMDPAAIPALIEAAETLSEWHEHAAGCPLSEAKIVEEARCDCGIDALRAALAAVRGTK